MELIESYANYRCKQRPPALRNLGRRPTLVMLHGLGSCADDWVYQLPDLGRHFRCLPLDLRGHGLSDKPPGPYSMAQFAADVSGLLHTLDIGPAHVLGSPRVMCCARPRAACVRCADPPRT
ncbi:MAG: alpha/beta fold hydrolase [Anaerolineae bacterium]|uniref:alpha/beta fold hydrolase n=1 Tax=Candidatus Amarolinea dominans TaxID=3140696 RepID=UPI0031346F6A|nr:alpha/beta fold hydrolase [Anaerolineae bacterium]